MRFNLYEAVTGPRPIALASAVGLLMLAVLVLLQYRSLSELESRTEGALKEGLRQTLLNVEGKLNSRISGIAEEALVPMRDMRLIEGGDPQQLRAHFSAVRRSHPEVERIFVVSSCGCDKEENGFAYLLSDALGPITAADVHDDAEVRRARHSFNMSRSTGNYVDPKRSFTLWQHACPSCGPGGDLTYMFYPLSDEPGTTRFAGVVLNEIRLASELLPDDGHGKAGGSSLPVPESGLVLAVHDDEGRGIFTNAPEGQEFPVTMRFGRPLTRWQAGIGFRGANIEQLAGENTRRTVAASVLVLGVFVLVMVLMLRIAGREMSLARAKSAFVSNVSHELKTPLASIRLFAEMLELGHVRDDHKRQEYYRIIGNECGRLSTLIDNVLDFSKIEAGRKVYRFAPCDIVEVVDSVVSVHRHRIEAAGFRFDVETPAGALLVTADRDAIAQVILNLLDNAVRYSPDVKEVSLALHADGREVRLEVSDRGLGIPGAELKRIFEKFHRVGNDLVHDVRGTGLGLSLVKHMVEAHEGRVEVISEVGVGSRFVIRIPRAVGPVAGPMAFRGPVTG